MLAMPGGGGALEALWRLLAGQVSAEPSRCGLMQPMPLVRSHPCMVQVWSMRTGLLQASCRGHDAEITDLAVSCDNSLVASSSMDGTIRVWQLEVRLGCGSLGWRVP